MKASTQEAGAHIKGSGLFSDASHLEVGGLLSQSPCLHLSGGEVFIRREMGTEQRDQGRGQTGPF